MPYDYWEHVKRYENSPDQRARQWPPDKWDLVYLDLGFTWCPVCDEYHNASLVCYIEGEVVNDASTGSALEIRGVPEVRGETG